MVTIQMILHPTDFSVPAKHAMGYAISLAREFKAKLCVLHVIPEISTTVFVTSPAPMPVQEVFNPLYPDPAAPLPTHELVLEFERRARKALDDLLPPEVRGSVSAECLIRRGAPFVEILRCAVEVGADLIVCGTHGHSSLKQALMGCVAEKVVRKSPCPVLTIRHPEHKFEMPT